MRSQKTAAKKLTELLKLPPQLQPGVPQIELIGQSTLILSRHNGLTEYTAQCISANSKLGRITVTGSGLNITQMNAETLTISGKITGVTYSEADR